VRVERCFAFVDLCGFTAFADRRGDDAAVAVLTALRTALREIAARRGVRVVKWLGDGAMLSGTDTSHVVALVVEITAQAGAGTIPLPLRAGLAEGPVIMFEGDDYVGRPANVASRLCGAAEPGQVLATPAAAAGAPAWVAAGDATPYAIPGLDRPVEAVGLRVAPGEHRVTDPWCGLDLPDVPGLVTGVAADGRVERFCSDACATAWGDARLGAARAAT
jgi:adenylate cyclase